MNTPKYSILTKESLVVNDLIDEISVFLFEHLDEYGDSIEAIKKAINYVFNDRGGAIIIQYIESDISGVIVLNKTGMVDYIPENILVYIALNKKYRGKGFGKKLMQKALNEISGNIALHVEKDNPARFLYEKLGFTNPYLEMRLIRE